MSDAIERVYPEWWWPDLESPARCIVAGASGHIGLGIKNHVLIGDFERDFKESFPFLDEKDRLSDITSLLLYLSPTNGSRLGLYNAFKQAPDGFIEPVVGEIVAITGEAADAVAAASKIPEELASSSRFEDLGGLLELSSIAVRGLTSPEY